MEFFSKKIIIISILIIVSSLFDLLDNTIIRLFNLEDEGTFALIVDFISPILEVSLMFWALLTGKKIIYQIRDEEEQYKRLVQLSPNPSLFIIKAEYSILMKVEQVYLVQVQQVN